LGVLVIGVNLIFVCGVAIVPKTKQKESGAGARRVGPSVRHAGADSVGEAFERRKIIGAPGWGTRCSAAGNGCRFKPVVSSGVHASRAPDFARRRSTHGQH